MTQEDNSDNLPSFYQDPFPELPIDEDYRLIEQSLDHAQAFLDYYTDPEVNQYILVTTPTTLEQAIHEVSYCRSLFPNKQGIHWAIASQDNNRMIGSIGLYLKPGASIAEICYDMNKQFWKRGITFKALQQVIRFAFAHTGITMLRAYTLKENLASTRLLTKLGFYFEGTLQKHRYFQGTYHDLELYTLSITNYPAKPSK